MSEKPSVGRIVHFYSKSIAAPQGSAPPGINGQGDGPYPAIVTQTFPGPYVNLKVLPGMAPPFDEGSVSHLDDAGENPGRWWVWPPRI